MIRIIRVIPRHVLCFFLNSFHTIHSMQNIKKIKPAKLSLLHLQFSYLYVSLVSGTCSETKKCIMVDFSWFWHMIICILRIQKIKIRSWGDFKKRPKTCPGRPKKQPKIFLAIFVKRPIKPLGKLVQTQKQIAKIFFALGATGAWSSGQICPNSRIWPNLELL